MFDWLSPWVFLQTMLRVAVVWLAFYGAGKLLRKPLRIDRAFPLLPSEIVGMLAFVILTVPLSLLGMLNRSVCPATLVLLAIPGALFTYGELRDRLPLRNPGLLNILLGGFLVFVLLLSFTNASMPNLAFDDPLITYAVQPDRWLNRGRIYWLEETVFSGFPLLYEMTSVWPASLSTDRMNQLSVLQVFQMSMLVLAVFRGLSILGVKRKLWIPVATIVFLTTLMYIWPAKAKTDTMALLFCTLAMVSAVRQRERNFTGSPLTSWLYMGMTLATKQTAIVTLVPFLLYSAGNFLKYSLKWKALALAALMAIPGVYAVRTVLKTGSPVYPVYPINSMLREGWDFNGPEENRLLNDRASFIYQQRSFPIMKHIGIHFAYMEGNFLLFLAGIATVLFLRRWGDALLAVPVLVYCAAAIVVFWPPWWGSKYAILLYPFIAILGARLLQRSKAGTAVALLLIIPSFIIPGFIAVAGDQRPFAYRRTVTESILMGRWQSERGYGMWLSTPEGMTQMWANSALPSNAVIFSIHEEKRYFFDGTVVVGWRHPLGQRLYLENSLEEEMAVLDGLGVTHVGFYRTDPAPLEQERRLVILDHVGIGELLEPLIMVDGGYLICSYRGNQIINPDASQ
jgi:hypothetical protein